VLFLRSPSGTDPANDLWLMDATGHEHRIVSAAQRSLAAELPAAERARRERMREVTEGITSYSVDDAGTFAVFTISGQGFLVDLTTSEVTQLPLPTGIVDIRISPNGEHIAYVLNGSLWRIALTARQPILVAESTSTTEVWGLADFIAAEELDRIRGYWWVGDALLVERYDESDVDTTWIADPSQPTQAPTQHRYPAAGTPNARVELWLFDESGSRREIERDHNAWPYVASVHDDHGLVISYLSRDQKSMRIDVLDSDTGRCNTLRQLDDAYWVDVHPGVPTRDASGALLTIEPIAGANRLCSNGEPISPGQRNVTALLDTSGVLLSQHSPETQVVSVRQSDGTWLDVSPADAWSAGAAAHDAMVLATATLHGERTSFTFVTDKGEHPIDSHAQAPLVHARPQMLRVTPRQLPAAVLLPEDHDGSALPVIMSPYGGPHAQRVINASGMFATEQWIANRGYAVVVIDGAGTPGRGPAEERLVAGDLAAPVLADQVAGLQAVAEQVPTLDLTHVGIRGWSFGGYLAALAVLERPDVFHAAVAGAPVTDWRLYDTAYTERYLGNPQTDDEPYRKSDVITRADQLTRPLLLIHGLADDNVLAAHTLRLSHALLTAGKVHDVLPLSGITHMTPQEVVAENLLLLEMDFFDRHLRGL